MTNLEAKLVADLEKIAKLIAVASKLGSLDEMLALMKKFDDKLDQFNNSKGDSNE